MAKFWLDGVCSKNMGIELQAPVRFSGASPKVSTVTVPGKNGDLHIYENAFENCTGDVDCFALRRDVYLTLSVITRWLFASYGYRRLEVTEEKDTYRMARVVNGPEAEIRMQLLAPFSLGFDCKPQRFLKSGEFPIKIQSGQSLYNAWQPALPLIQITGTGDGQLVVGKSTVNITGMTGSITLDSEVQNAYDGTTNKNNSISISGGFPVLEHGESLISYSGGITAVNITPRWWML